MLDPKKQYKGIETYTIPRYKDNLILKLDMNENPLGCSPKVIEALKNIPADYISKYPAYGEIEEKIAQLENLKPENIMISNGGDGAIKALHHTYINDGDEVLYASPTYVMYLVNSLLTNAKVVTVPYKKKWEYPTDSLIQKINTKTKLIFICSPNNPTGDLVPEEDIIKILEAAPHALVMIDEAYYRFVNQPTKTLKHLISKYDNLAILRTFSKDYSLAGLRVGYLMSHEKNIEEITKSMDPFSVNNIAVYAASSALDDQDYVDKYVEEVNLAKKEVIEKLEKNFNEVYNTHANFVWFYVGNQQEWFFKKLLKKGYKIRRYPNKPEVKGYIRLTIGSRDQMRDVITHFNDYDALIFDIDGVLVDESTSYRKAIQCTYKHFSNKDISLEKIQEYKNQSGFNNDWKLTKHLLDEQSLNIPLDDVINKFQEYYFNDGKGLISEEKLLIDKEIIKSLASKYKLSVFTGRPKAEAEFILKKEGILNCFDHLITMDETSNGRGKPSPYGLYELIKLLKTDNIIYIGDMPDDITSATASNVDSIGILPPQDKSNDLRNTLLDEGAIEVYHNLKEAIDNIVRKEYEKI